MSVNRIYREEPPAPQLVVGVGECARRLGVSRKTLWLWIRAGAGPKSFRPNGGLRRFAVADIEAWIRSEAREPVKTDVAGKAEVETTAA